MIRETLTELEAIEARLEDADEDERGALNIRRAALLERCRALTPVDRVHLARHPRRPRAGDILAALCTDFFEQRGDRHSREDASILGGIALFHGRPVTVIAHRKGHDIQENMACNFGMPGPEGYRKAQRILRAAEKFGRPVITLIDTPGAYPGMEAEAHGQGEAIASSMALMSRLRVPIVAVITGEGNSGGALALGVADAVLMLENAYYAVLSPEGFASILWKNPARRDEACAVMKLTARELMDFGVVDAIVPEPIGGAQRDPQAMYDALDAAIAQALAGLDGLTGDALVARRYEKFRHMAGAGKADSYYE